MHKLLADADKIHLGKISSVKSKIKNIYTNKTGKHKDTDRYIQIKTTWNILSCRALDIEDLCKESKWLFKKKVKKKEEDPVRIYGVGYFLIVTINLRNTFPISNNCVKI